MAEKAKKKVKADKEKERFRMEIGENVRVVREQAHLTQERFAECIEVTPQYISDLERGKVGISVQTLKRMCKVMSVSSDQILFRKRSENDISVTLEKCRLLPKEHFAAITDIINKFIEAIAAEHIMTKKTLEADGKKGTEKR